jgi:hypothetical protein
MLADGTHLLLFYNNNDNGFSPTDRNPYWLTAGREAGGQVLWSQPEIIIYDRIRSTAPGYPDIIQDPTDPGRVVITETEKHIARLHPIPPSILTALVGQFEANATAEAGVGSTRLLVDARTTHEVATPSFGRLDSQAPPIGAGLTVAVVLTTLPSSSKKQVQVAQHVLLDSRNSTKGAATAGVTLQMDPISGIVRLTVSDGTKNESLNTDPVCSRALVSDGMHFIGFVVDAGPLIIRVMLEMGMVCERGWAGQCAGHRSDADWQQ